MKLINIRIHENLLQQVEDYKKEQGISSRTAAFLELVRKGLGKG